MFATDERQKDGRFKAKKDNKRGFIGRKGIHVEKAPKLQRFVKGFDYGKG